MIDIYDEVGYVKEVLAHGFSERWERDALLLARYYRIEGKKKPDIKKIVKEKVERYVKSYRKYRDYPRANKMVDLAFKKIVPLREIKEVKIPIEVVKWFLNLETSYKISDEQVLELKKKRKGLKINNHLMNFNRIKFLFTLYFWTRIQENYLDNPYMHYLSNYMKRFKHDADLNTGFSINKEKDLINDLGLIYVNFAQGIDCRFIKENSVLRLEEDSGTKRNYDEEECFVVTGEDLYKPGYWLTKQKFGKFVCQRCGKEFAHYNDSKQEKKRKYCKECYNDIHHNERGLEDTKVIKCIDCGIDIEINIKNNKTCRCKTCQKELRKVMDRKRKQRNE